MLVGHRPITSRLLEEYTELNAPKYLMDMPKRVLFGRCQAIEKWCAENEKVRPTLLDLANARKARKGERR